MTENMINLPQMSNIGIPGQFAFRIDQTKTGIYHPQGLVGNTIYFTFIIQKDLNGAQC